MVFLVDMKIAFSLNIIVSTNVIQFTYSLKNHSQVLITLSVWTLDKIPTKLNEICQENQKLNTNYSLQNTL